MAGSRYTKSIPEFVYFIEQGDGWFAGPYVKNPMKGENANTDALVICKVQRITKLVTEPQEKKLSIVERYGIKKEKCSRCGGTGISTNKRNDDTISCPECYGTGKVPLKPPLSQSAFTDNDLQVLKNWLKSDEGRKTIKESQDKADAVERIINKMNDIDPEILRTPFGSNKNEH